MWLDIYFEELKSFINIPEIKNESINAKNLILKIREDKNKIIFIGNGGSNTIANHGAVDFINQLGIQCISVNDSAFLTAGANDFGYDDIFERYINLMANENDLIIAISSSGQSKNIINAVKRSKELKCKIITFSGFDNTNPLRKLGNVNFWLDSHKYNIVETVHNIWLVTLCDLIVKDEIHKIGDHGIEFK